MLKLQNIHVQLARPLFTAASEKYLRVSVGNVAKKTANPAKVVNEKSIEWSEALALPLLYNREFGFEIYDKHEFGYNPEEFKTMLVGTLSILDLSQKHSTWEIYTTGNEKIGFLSASIVSKTTSLARRESMIRQKNQSKLSASQEMRNNSSVSVAQEKKVLRVVSMVARISNGNMKKGYISMQVGSNPDKVIKTKAIKSRAGELVFIDAHNVQLDASDTDAQVRVYTINGITKEETMIGQGTLELIAPKPSKRVVLVKEGFEAGEVYIDSRIVDQSKANNINASQSRIFNQSTEYVEEGRARSITPSKSIDFTRLEHFGIKATTSRVKPILGDLNSSMVSTLSTRRYKNSVVNHNNNIVFPKEKRFMLYQDKQNQRISYLKDRSFEFQSPGSGRNYRGKSIGYGGKTDFCKGKEAVPGVGNYRLPSIWDRY